jgi:hypothetical protein
MALHSVSSHHTVATCCSLLTKVFFRRVKVQFGQFQRIKELSKVTSTCERVFMAMQGSIITGLIWNSWCHAGIVPVIDFGNCIRAEPDYDRISCDPVMHYQQPIQEDARKRPVCKPQFGVLNKKQYELQRAGCCPFCERFLGVSEEEDGEVAKKEEEAYSD